MTYLIEILTFLQNLAWGRSFPWGKLPWGLGNVVWLILTALFIYGLFFSFQKIPYPKKIFKTSDTSLFRGLLGFNILVQLFNYFWFKDLGYQFPFFSIAVLLAGFYFIKLNKPHVSFWICISVLVGSILHFPIAQGRSDMLLVIETAWKNYFAGGDPFAPLDLPSGKGRMPYLFFTFISHAPAAFLGIDLRWNQFLYRVLWGVILLLHFRKKSNHTSEKLWLAHLLWLNPYFNYRHELYFEFFILGIVALFAYEKFKFILAPLLLLTRQWAWIFIPFHFIQECKKGSQKNLLSAVLRPTLTWLLGGGIVLALAVLIVSVGQTKSLSLPYFLNIFLDSILNRGFESLGVIIRDYGLSLSPLIDLAGSNTPFKALQIFLFFGFLGMAVTQPLKKTLDLSEKALILFLILNQHFWLYFWFTPIFYGACRRIFDASNKT